MYYTFPIVDIQTLVHELHNFSKLPTAVIQTLLHEVSQFDGLLYQNQWTTNSSISIASFHEVVKCHEIFNIYVH